MTEDEQLEAALREARETHEVPDGLEQRIAAAARQPQPRRSDHRRDWLNWLLVHPWRTASLAALPLVFGFVVGVAVPEPGVSDDWSAVSGLAFDSLEWLADPGDAS